MSRLLHIANQTGWVCLFAIATASAVAASELSLVISFTNERLEFGPGDIVQAMPVFPQKNVPAVAFQMSAEKARKFGALTAKHVGEKVNIIVCGKVTYSPLITTPILSGTGVINSDLSLDGATNMAIRLKRGTCD